ncbi:NAD(P)-binding protein, partial [Atractiella rhizophila]
GRVCIVTGGYGGGIGEEIARVLVQKGAKVYIAGRSREKGEKTINRLLKETGKEKSMLLFLKLDLGSLEAVKKATEEFLSRESRLDLLINNAGVMNPPGGSKTSDGFELQWGTNVLGHFVFTIPLLPLMEKTADAQEPGRVRIVNLSSAANQMAPKEGITLDDKKRGTYGRSRDYGQSKLGNILFARSLSRRYPKIVSLACHPGIIATPLWRHGDPIQKFVRRYMMDPPEKGALTPLYCALDTQEVGLKTNGWYGRPYGRLFPTAQHPKATDEELADRVWEWCHNQLRELI